MMLMKQWLLVQHHNMQGVDAAGVDAADGLPDPQSEFFLAHSAQCYWSESCLVL